MPALKPCSVVSEHTPGAAAAGGAAEVNSSAVQARCAVGEVAVVDDQLAILLPYRATRTRGAEGVRIGEGTAADVHQGRMGPLLEHRTIVVGVSGLIGGH